jgi:hypothetical protein
VTFPNPPGNSIVPRGYRCAVCTAGGEIVAFVDRLIVGGSTYVEVHRALAAINEARVAQNQPEIGYQSVQRHGKEHLPARSAAVREIVERRARAAQLDVDEGTANILTTAAYAEAVMTKAFQDISIAEVTIGEGLQAAKFLEQLMRAERGNVGLETAFAELGYLIEAVKEVVPQALWPAITSKIDEKRGTRIIDAQVAEEVEEFDPGVQPEEEFNPADDGDEDF